MRVNPLLMVAIISLAVGQLGGCGGEDMTPQGPEMGSVQRYLDEHPEENDDPDAVSEEDEFSAAEDE